MTTTARDDASGRSEAEALETEAAMGELAVWEAFRALRLEGRTVHAHLAELLRAPAVLEPTGDTLDIGGGDGHLWRIGGEPLLKEVLARGCLHLADADPDLVARCSSDPDIMRDGVRAEVADVRALPHPDRRFARIVVTHVLHWCGTPAGISSAVSELARVLREDGNAFVVTVDESVHMREVYALMQEAAEALARRGLTVIEPMPRASPRILPFCAGNAMSYLRTCFEHVERIDCDHAHLVDAQHAQLGAPAEEFTARYFSTLPFLAEARRRGRVPREFFDEVRELVRGVIVRAGVLRMSRRDVIYRCAGPIRTGPQP